MAGGETLVCLLPVTTERSLMIAHAADALDAKARRELTDETARHAEALGAISAADRDGFVAELDRHLRGIDRILANHARRHPHPVGP
jgi:hypothetical protein